MLIVYMVGKSLLILRNKTISLKTFFKKLVSKDISLEISLAIHCFHEGAPGE